MVINKLKKEDFVLKKMITAIITFLILITINWAASYIFSLGFFDLSILIGVVGVIIIKFFNSSGGVVSDTISMMNQSTTGVKQEMAEKKFQPTVAFYVAIAYLVVAIVGSFIYYSDYFI